MPDAPANIVLLEFQDEAEAYAAMRRESGGGGYAEVVVSLDPTVEVWLKRQGIHYVTSLGFFSSEAHERTLRKSDKLLKWLGPRFHIEDGLGISEAYDNALTWHSRYFIHHMLLLCEILSEAARQYPGAGVTAFLQRPTGQGSPMVRENERYLGWLAEDHCRERGVPFSPIPMPPLKDGPGLRGASVPIFKRLAFQGMAAMHRLALRRLGRWHPILAVSRAYRMQALTEKTRQETHELPWVVFGDFGDASVSTNLKKGLRAVLGGLHDVPGDAYQAEVWPQLLSRGRSPDARFNRDLAGKLEGLAAKVEEERDLFCHRGIHFGHRFAAKLRNGIGPAMQLQHRETQAMSETLRLLKPRLVVTPFGRRSLHALGDLARRQGIPGLLISHGSFTPVKSDLEQMGWDVHSNGMFWGSYTHAALQSPLSEQFARTSPDSVKYVPTGPLAWGAKVKRGPSSELRAKLAPRGAGDRIVMHASSPKYRHGTHFHVYETPDEYVQAMRELVLAMEEVPDAFLIIKFRTARMSKDQLLELLPRSDRFCVSVEEPFLEVLGLADLLVSFSSTTTEEALQNRVPLLLYGGHGRYRHIDGFEVTPSVAVQPGAVYTVREAEHLGDAVKRILDANGKPPLPEELFRPYVYDPGQITEFPELVRQLVSAELTD